MKSLAGDLSFASLLVDLIGMVHGIGIGAPGRTYGDPVLPVLASGSSTLVTGTLVVFVGNCQGTAALARTRIPETIAWSLCPI